MLRRLLALVAVLALVPLSPARASAPWLDVDGEGTWTFTLSKPATLRLGWSRVSSYSNDTWGFWVEGADRATAGAYGGLVESNVRTLVMGEAEDVRLPAGRYTLTTFGATARKDDADAHVAFDVEAPPLRRVPMRRVEVYDAMTTTPAQTGETRVVRSFAGRPRAAFFALHHKMTGGKTRVEVCVRSPRGSCADDDALRSWIAEPYVATALAPPGSLWRDGVTAEWVSRGTAAYVTVGAVAVVLY